MHMQRQAYFLGAAYAAPRKIKFPTELQKNRFFNFNLEKKQLNQNLYFFLTKKTVFLRNFNSSISIFKKRISVFFKFRWALHMQRPKNMLGAAYASPTGLFMLNLTYFLLNTFLKKCHFKLQTSFYSNMVFQSYTNYIVNDETSSLDMLATSQYQRVAS